MSWEAATAAHQSQNKNRLTFLYIFTYNKLPYRLIIHLVIGSENRDVPRDPHPRVM